MCRNIPFTHLDNAEGFAGYSDKGEGIHEKVLSDDMDRAAMRGKRTRLLKLDAGCQTPAAHAHDYWEEIYVISGSMIEGTAETGEKRAVAPAFASREPGFVHGPVRTDEECLLIEFSWFPDAND